MYHALDGLAIATSSQAVENFYELSYASYGINWTTTATVRIFETWPAMLGKHKSEQ
jgi:hypothetical protein